MPIDVEQALADGLDRTIQRNGVVLVGVVFVLAVLQSIVQQSAVKPFLQDTLATLAADAEGETLTAIQEMQQGVAEGYPLALLDAPAALLSAAGLALFLASVVVDVGAVRTFVGDETERLPLSNFTHRLLWTLLNLLVGFIAYAVVVTVGLAVFVLPGIYLAVALFFYNYEIIVEEKDAVAALSGSWRLTSGNRLLLFVVGVVFVILEAIVFVIPASSPVLALVSTLAGSVVGVFGIAVAAQVYNQLRTDGTEPGVPDPSLAERPTDGFDESGRTAGEQTGDSERRDDEF